MSTVGYPDTFYLSSAIGWLELGNPGEARLELKKVNHGLRSHPDVLEIEWSICAVEGNWQAGLRAARQLVEKSPDNPHGLLHEAYAIRRVPDGGIKAAWEILLPAAQKFPKEATIPYNLACYAAQMNRIEEARKWLQLSFRLGDSSAIKQMAATDDDLQPLWDEIESWR